MRKHFLTGLAILLPVVVTVAIIVFLVNLLTQPFLGMLYSVIDGSGIGSLVARYPGAAQALRVVGQLMILVLLFMSTVVLGMLGRWFFFRWLIRMGDAILHRLPIVNKVYKTTQDIINTIFRSQARSFKDVVMVPFPTPDTYCVGFVSAEAPPVCKGAVRRDLLSVFVPTTPNPTSGYLLLYPVEQVHYVDMKVEDAVKFIISCGVIHSSSELRPPSSPKKEGKKKEPSAPEVDVS